jgi:hypothetical protein
MKTDIDIKDDLFMYIKGSDLANAVTGKLEKAERPTGSMAEDIVISVEENENGGIQAALCTVNIYVADVLRDNQYIENTIRLRELCAMAKTLLEVAQFNEARFYLTAQRVKKVDGVNEHRIENRVIYKYCKE